MLPGLGNKPLIKRLGLADLSASVQALINGALQKSGGTMTGKIVLDGDATLALHPVTKQQLEDSVDTIDTALGLRMQYSLAASQATTSGTAFDFTGIPSWAKRVTVMAAAVSTNGSSPLCVQIGAASIETSGYSSGITIASTSAITTYSSTTDFPVSGMSAGSSVNASVMLTLLGGNTWVLQGCYSRQSDLIHGTAAGGKTLSGALERLRFTTAGGSDTFDAGSVSILIEG